MAERLNTYTFKGRGAPKYDWVQWLDGSVWKLRHGVDFNIPVEDFRSSAYGAATRKGGKVHSSVDGESVVVQFYTTNGAA